MIPLLFMKSMSSMKKVGLLVAGVIIGICFLPMLAIIALAGSNTISTTGTLYNGPGDTADTYAFGNCTYWVSLLRAQINEPIPNTWGNASTWASRAAKDGYLVDQDPSYGAIMQISTVDKGLGHVAFVESVNPTTGAWTISQMNVVAWNEVNEETYPALAAQQFNFIHQPIGVVSSPNL